MIKTGISFVGFAIVALLLLVGESSAFVPTSKSFVGTKDLATTTTTTNTPFRTSTHPPQQHITIQKQRKSLASIQTQSLFGLGGPEIGIILIAAAFLLGPQKLAELGKDAGKIAGELKEVPKEFQKGMAEGEAQALDTKKAIADSSSISDADDEEAP